MEEKQNSGPSSAPRQFQPRTPFSSTGGPQLTQQSIIKNVQQLMPKMQDQDRHSLRDQIVDSLLRENSSSRERLQNMNKMIQEYLSSQQQQSKQSQNNDECSSGGTTPTPVQGNDGVNLVSQVIKLAVLLEEAIFEKYQDSKSANYKTLMRRLTQAIRQKEDQKQILINCSDKESIMSFVNDFQNQRGATVAPGTGNEAEQQNPFGAPRRGAPPSRGGPPGRGAPRGGMARGGAPRFVAPMPQIPTTEVKQEHKSPLDFIDQLGTESVTQTQQPEVDFLNQYLAPLNTQDKPKPEEEKKVDEQSSNHQQEIISEQKEAGDDQNQEGEERPDIDRYNTEMQSNNQDNKTKLDISIKSGRLTPPSGYSGGQKKSSRLAAGERFDSQSNIDETGSEIQMSQEHTAERFMGYQELSSRKNEDDLKSDYKQNTQVIIKLDAKEFASEYKTQPASNSRREQLQVDGFLNQQMMNPPESVKASVVSIPITTFEDTQQMLRAYKKKKRDLAKMKENFFKMETQFISIQQKHALVEDELAQTNKKLAKAEKQVKQMQIREQQKDSSLLEKQLSIKNEEAEIFQKQLQVQKQENQKLREKVKELLSKQVPNTDQVGVTQKLEVQLNFQTQKSIKLEKEKEELIRNHQLEMQQFSQSNDISAQLQAQIQEYQSQASQFQQDLAQKSQDYDHLEQDIQAQISENEQLRNQMSDMQAYQQQLQDQIMSLQDNQTKMEFENHELKNAIEKNMNENSSMAQSQQDSWQVLEQSQEQEKQMTPPQQMEKPEMTPPQQMEKPLIQSQYFGQEKLQPRRENNFYDFTIDHEEPATEVKEPEPPFVKPKVAQNLFNDYDNAKSFFDEKTIKQEPEKPKPPQQVAKPQPPPKTNPVVINSNPYNFFDDEPETVVSTADNVIPNSMFD